jgi:hypothetical protein
MLGVNCAQNPNRLTLSVVAATVSHKTKWMRGMGSSFRRAARRARALYRTPAPSVFAPAATAVRQVTRQSCYVESGRVRALARGSSAHLVRTIVAQQDVDPTEQLVGGGVVEQHPASQGGMAAGIPDLEEAATAHFRDGQLVLEDDDSAANLLLAVGA